jgi:integrase
MLRRRRDDVRLRSTDPIKIMDANGNIVEDRTEQVVFSSPSGHVRDPRNTNRDLRQFLDTIDAPDGSDQPHPFGWVTSHVFRKTVATRLDEAGMSARQIADVLGHAHPSMTQDVYMGRKVVSAEAAVILANTETVNP